MWGISLMFKCFFYCVGKFPSIWVDCFYRFSICFFFCFVWSGGFLYLSYGIFILSFIYCFTSCFSSFSFLFFLFYCLCYDILFFLFNILLMHCICLIKVILLTFLRIAFYIRDSLISFFFFTCSPS